ncbi:MAG: AI-2E family transporter [Ruminococcaceae bacterium]|nr:AI-2E family transporter [Oscillospiraceae bacterium]
MKFDVKTCVRLGLTALVTYLLISYWDKVSVTIISALAPIIIGFIIAYLVNIIMCAYEKFYFPKSKKKFAKKSRRAVCMILAFLTVFAVIALVVGLVVPEFISCIQVLIEKLPKAITKLIGRLNEIEFISDDVISALSSINWQERIAQLAGIATTGVTNIVGVIISSVTAVFSGIVTGFLSLIFAIYFLLGKNKLLRQVCKVTRHYLSEKLYGKLKYIFKILNDSFHRYIVGQCIEAVILGVLCTIGMLILGLPYATMIGALIAFTALIPIVGAFLGASVGAFMILTEDPVKALIFIIYILVLQQLEGNLIYPKVVGSSIGIPAIWVLAAVTIGGGVFGVGGMLLFVPLTAAIFRIIRDDLKAKPSP